MTVFAADDWPTNAHLIEDCVALGYLRHEWRTLDPTFGLGSWWARWKPDVLVTHDLRLDDVDFRDLPYGPEEFDVVTYDPPYVALGGRASSTLDYADRYGLLDAPRTPAQLQALINDGLRECVRVVRRGGFVLVKCADYVSSGRYWAGTHETLTAARVAGLEQVDRFEHIRPVRPQPPGRRQVHARRNLSTLLVFKRAH